MALAVESPAREDLSFRTNDDKRVGARWLKSDATTPVVISSAVLTLRLVPPPPNPYPIVAPLIFVPPEEHAITSTTPGDPNGWIDPIGLASGIVLVQIPHGIWTSLVGRSGTWDLVADGEGLRRCLVRGALVVEEGISA